MRHARVAVVGDGAVGRCAALSVARHLPDVEVVLVGGGPIPAAGGASRAAGAMLGVFGEVTKYSTATPGSRAKLGLALLARVSWSRLLDHLAAQGDDGLLTARDTFVILNARSGRLDDDNWRALREVLVQHGEPHALVDEVPGLHPVPDARPLAALHLPAEGAVDSGAVLQSLDRALERSRVRREGGPATEILAEQGRVIGVRSAGVVLQADAVVVAAGAASTRLLRGVLPPHAVQPVFNGSGVALATERVLGKGFTSVVRTVTRAGSCGLHVLPLGGAREYVGATNVLFAEPETRPHLGVVHFLIECAVEQLDQRLTYSRIDDLRVGNRPVALDTLPLLGPTEVVGLHVLTGTYRDGFLLAPLLGELLAGTLASGRSGFPDVFAPQRPPTLPGTRQEAVDEFCLQMVSSAYEGGTRLTAFVDSDELEGLYRGRAEDVFDRLGHDGGLPVDVVNFLALSRKSDRDVDDVRDYLRARSVA